MSLTGKELQQALTLVDKLAGLDGLVPPQSTAPLHKLWNGASAVQKDEIARRGRVEFVRKRLDVSVRAARILACEMTRTERNARDPNWEREYNRAVVMFREHVKRTGAKHAGNNWGRGAYSIGSYRPAAAARWQRRGGHAGAKDVAITSD